MVVSFAWVWIASWIDLGAIIGFVDYAVWMIDCFLLGLCLGGCGTWFWFVLTGFVVWIPIFGVGIRHDLGGFAVPCGALVFSLLVIMCFGFLGFVGNCFSCFMVFVVWCGVLIFWVFIMLLWCALRFEFDMLVLCLVFIIFTLIDVLLSLDVLLFYCGLCYLCVLSVFVLLLGWFEFVYCWFGG